jgi:hypothetical protein
VSLIGLMRCVVALSLVGGGVAYGQATLPATAPTAAASAAVAAPHGVVVDSGVGGAAAHETHDAVVHVAGGKVEVVADGSSLNQILREIGRVTGIKITGSVADEPVYGTYGPAPVSEILSTLLDGTGSNMLLREATAVRPGELFLTPRTGGVTPPDPHAPSPLAGYEEPNVPGSKNYQRPREAWMDATPRGGPANGGEAPERQSPQQIYQQLQRLQQTQPPQQPQLKPQEQ